MEAFTNDENRWANDIGHRIFEEKNKSIFDVETIIQDCETNAKDKTCSVPFRECMAHAAQFLRIAMKYQDANILNCAELAVYGTMYDNWYK